MESVAYYRRQITGLDNGINACKGVLNGIYDKMARVQAAHNEIESLQDIGEQEMIDVANYIYDYLDNDAWAGELYDRMEANYCTATYNDRQKLLDGIEQCKERVSEIGQQIMEQCSVYTDEISRMQTQKSVYQYLLRLAEQQEANNG